MSPLRGVASLGVRPTMHEHGKPVLEVHLFDFNHEIYGRHLRVHFLHKLRDEEKYPDLESLTKTDWTGRGRRKELFFVVSSAASTAAEKSLLHRSSLIFATFSIFHD